MTWHSEMKRKASFPFAFLSFFRNFAQKLITNSYRLKVYGNKSSKIQT